MPAIAVETVVVVDEKDVDRLFLAFDNAIKPTSLQAMLSLGVAQDLQRRAGTRFRNEGDSASGRWRALRPATEEIRESLGYPAAHPINEREGDLRNFVTRSTGSVKLAGGGAELIWPGPGGVEEEKLRVAQQGSRRGDNPLFANARTPARPVVALGQLDVVDLLLTLNNHLVSHMTGVGFIVGAL